jgi:hypothetical protein
VLVDPDAAQPVKSIASGLSPVYAVAAYAYTDPSSGERSLRVLAGTACGGVRRYVVNPGPTGDWALLESTGGAWGGNGAFVRDIEIDPDA